MTTTKRSAALAAALIVFVFILVSAAGAWQLGMGARKQGNPPDGADVSGALYTGMLGPTKIVLHVIKGGDGDTFEGRYFYLKYRKAIPLKGTRLPDGEYRLQELPGGKPNGAEWLLSTRQEEASGYYCRCDVRKKAPRGVKPPLSIIMERAAAGVTYEDLMKPPAKKKR